MVSFADVGLTFGATISLPITCVVVSFLSMALYNFIELNFLLFFTFKRRKGLYFWSFLVATWGVAFYAIGFILKDFNLSSRLSLFYVTLIIIGWSAMVTGQSMVLYSRLNLVVRSRVILRLVLAMIIVNAIILHIPTTILCYGSNSTQYRRFAIPYAIYERVEVSIFFVQELIISSLYLYETCKLMYMGGTLNEIHGEAGRRLLVHLIFMSVIVILLDTAILALQFKGRYTSQTAVKGFIYSVKLKVEYDILNRLVDLARRASDPNSTFDYGDNSRYTSSNSAAEECQSNGGINHPRRFSCPWRIFSKKVKQEVVGPAENGVRHGSQVFIR